MQAQTEFNPRKVNRIWDGQDFRDAMGATLSDVYYWWLGAFQKLPGSLNLPDWLKGAAPLILRISENGHAELSCGVQTQAGTVALEKRLRQVARDWKVAPGGVSIRLDQKPFFIRSISPLNLPASQLAKTALLDLRANTPFKENDVHVLGLEPAGKGARYAVIKKSVVDPILSALASAGLFVQGLELVKGAGTHAVSPLSMHGLTSGQKLRGQRMTIPAVSVLAVSVLLTGVHAWYRYQSALEQLNNQVQLLTVEAKITRTALDKRAASLAELTDLRKTIEDSEPVSGLWEELARLLPDSAYLTDMDVRDGQVVITGYAAEAAALVVALEQSPTFEQASFTAPVVRAFDQNAERFQIRVSVKGGS